MKRKMIGIITIIILAVTFTGIFVYKEKSKNLNLIYEDNKQSKNEYDAASDINKALSSLNSSNKAKILTDADTTKNLISLSFEDINDDETLLKTLELLKKYKIKATFFVSGINCSENAEIVKKINREGHEIGSATLYNKKNIDEMDSEEIVKDFAKANKIIESFIGEKPELLKCNSTEYTDNILSIAYACDNKYVVKSSHYLNNKSFKNYEQASSYIKNLKNGTILSIKDDVLDEKEYEAKKENSIAIDKQAGVAEKSDIKNEEVTTVEVIEWILKALDEQERKVVKVSRLKNMDSLKNTKSKNNVDFVNLGRKWPDEYNMNYNNSNTSGYSNKYNDSINSEESNIDFTEFIERNNGKEAKVNSEIYTTANKLTYTFRGIKNDEVLNNVLKSLNDVNAKATFFVTKEEIEKYPERIDKILKYGHEIANGGVSTSSHILEKSTEEICNEIYIVDRLLKERGIESYAYMPGYGYVNSNIKEAVSTINLLEGNEKYELFTYSKSPVNSTYKDMKAEEIISKYFNVNTYLSLRKGEIVYFRLDSDIFYDKNKIADMIRMLTNRYVKNGYIHKYNSITQGYDLVQKPLNYSLDSLSSIQKDSQRYKITTFNNYLPTKTTEDAVQVMNRNYIGNEYVTLHGFSEAEQVLLDKTGTIDTNNEDVVFLTFDDWGSDVVVNEILDVLRKHNAEASFFVISKFCDVNSSISNSNPNLLRTIALDGHDIASHSYEHEVLTEDSFALSSSLPKSYSVLFNVAGDLNVVKPYFRPPTLAVSKHGLTTVFEAGFEYSVGANISTHDYEANSSDEILESIEEGLIEGKGNIVVLHINNQAYYTAEAVDKFLTNNENMVYGKKYRIAKLSDYLK